MNIVDFSIKRPVFTTVIVLACVVFGALAYLGIPVSLFPDIKVPMVTIQTVYAGASPQVIETQITKKIEDQVSSIGDLDYITSYSMDSVSYVIVNFIYGKDENLALQEVKDKVEVIISDLPDDAKKPAISKVDIATMTPVMNLAVEGDMGATELYEFASSNASKSISQVSGVGQVELSGGQEREIRVELSRNTVFERNVPIEQVGGLLAAANIELPGGNLSIQGQDVPVRMKGEFESLDQMRNVDVPTRMGVYKLRQLAEVKDTSKTVRERTILINAKASTRNDNALLMKVIKNPTANTIDVVEGVQKVIPRIEAQSGGRVHLKVLTEDATYVRDTVDDTFFTVILGIVLTALVLLFFLHDLRSTLIVALVMPISIIATFFVMKLMGISLNMLSLMGLSTATGALVADAVIIIENIFRFKEEGHNRLEAASKGPKEVMVAVIAATLTHVSVFLPLGSMSGVMGSVLSNFAYTIVISLAFSLFFSFTLIPLMSSRILPETKKKEGKLSLRLEAMFKGWEEGYRNSLKWILKNRRRAGAVILATAVVFVGSIMLFAKVKFEMMPITDGGKVKVSVELPQGVGIDDTAMKLKQIEDRVLKYKEVETILTTIGSLGSMDKDVSLAYMNVYLVPKAKRTRSNSDIAAALTRDLSDIPGATIRVDRLSEISLSNGAPVDMYLRGEDNAVLQRLADQIKAKLVTIPGMTNVMLSSKEGKNELVFEPNRKRISEDGLTVNQIAISLRAAVDGLVMTTYKDAGEEYDVRVVMKGSSLLDVNDLRNIPIVSAAGTYPLSRYADVRFSNGYSKIMHNNKTRTIEISAELLPGASQGSVLSAAMAAAGKVELPSGYTLKTAGGAEDLGKTINDLLMVFVIAIVLIYLLLSAILESFVQPLFILATVPLAIIGVVIFSLGTNTTLNFIAMLGIIMLIGIVVVNAILILEHYNLLKKQGVDAHEALIEACPIKLKAILMSNIAQILGMLPMALGIGASGAEMRAPLGVVTIGGIVSATVMTLWVLPALEFMLARSRQKKAARAAAAV